MPKLPMLKQVRQKKMGGKLYDVLHPQGIYSDTNRNLICQKSGKKMITNDGRIAPKAHAHLQTMTKTPAKFQKVWYKTVRAVVPTSYPCHPVTSKKQELRQAGHYMPVASNKM